MDQKEIEQALAALLRERTVITVTSKRGNPAWLGDDVGTIFAIEGSTLKIRDRDTTMGSRAISVVSLEDVVAIRAARASDRPGVHNDRCSHKPYGSGPHCAEMSCPNYVNKHIL